MIIYGFDFATKAQHATCGHEIDTPTWLAQTDEGRTCARCVNVVAGYAPDTPMTPEHMDHLSKMFGPAEPLLYPGDETLERSSRTQFMADYLTGKPMIVRYDPDAPTGRRDLRRFL